MKKLVLGLIAFIFICATAVAVPAYPGLITETQPDGTTISFYLRGDENFSFYMTEDGYLIAHNEGGVFEYAQLNDDMTVVPLGVKVSDVSERGWKEKRFVKNLTTVMDMSENLKSIAEKRTQQRQRDMHRAAKYPTQGSPKSLVILVNFQDLKFTRETALEDFNAMLNADDYSVNGATSSARVYFRESSFGQFDPEFVVVGPYDLPENVEYYGGNGKRGGGGDLHADSMIVQACRLAKENGINFVEFDTDSNQILDNVFVYYAGHNEAEYGGEDKVWPHRGTIRGNKTIDGIKLQGYACTSELKGSKGDTQCGIGTFCHEFGHVLELPDLYVTDYSHDGPTPQSWDIMDNGSYNNKSRTPPTYSSYERFFCGWLVPEYIDSVPGLHHLEPLYTSNKAYIFSKTKHNLNGYEPNPKEFFMLENRQRIGIDSLAMPGTGLLVTHIDYDWMYWMMGLNNPNGDPNHMRVQIVCASSTTKGDMEANTFPGADEVSTLYFTFHDKTVWETPVVSIREHEKDITFIYGETPETPNASFANKLSDFDTYYGIDQVQVLEIVFRNIQGEVKFSFDDNRHYIFRGMFENDSLGKETRFLTINVPTTDEYHFKTQVIFRPRNVSYGEYYADRLIVESEEFITELPIKGISRRPINIVTPTAYPATDITKNSFVANWSYDENATGYYLSVYTKSDEESDETEKFNIFGEGKPEGWKYNFATTNRTYTGSAPLSLQFTSATDTLWTKKYFMPVKSISFWARSLNSAKGTIYVDALIDSVWTNILTQPFENSTINKTFTAEVPAGECHQFKVYVNIDNQTTRTALLFDDFKAYFENTINYLVYNEEVLDVKKYVSGYNPKVKHYYCVRATDKEVDDSEGKFENVSDYSNEICVGEEDNKGSGKVAALNVSFVDGHFVVNLDEIKANYKIYIYCAADGRLIDVITPEEKDVVLPRLTPNLYVVKYSEEGKVRRKDAMAKIFY